VSASNGQDLLKTDRCKALFPVAIAIVAHRHTILVHSLFIVCSRDEYSFNTDHLTLCNN